MSTEFPEIPDINSNSPVATGTVGYTSPVAQTQLQRLQSQVDDINTATAAKTAKSKAAVDELKQFTTNSNTDLASIMKQSMMAAMNHPQFEAIASHPDFPALASDNGVQQLVGALTNQVGKVLNGIKGSGQNVEGVTRS